MAQTHPPSHPRLLKITKVFKDTNCSQTSSRLRPRRELSYAQLAVSNLVGVFLTPDYFTHLKPVDTWFAESRQHARMCLTWHVAHLSSIYLRWRITWLHRTTLSGVGQLWHHTVWSHVSCIVLLRLTWCKCA